LRILKRFAHHVKESLNTNLNTADQFKVSAAQRERSRLNTLFRKYNERQFGRFEFPFVGFAPEGRRACPGQLFSIDLSEKERTKLESIARKYTSP